MQNKKLRKIKLPKRFQLIRKLNKTWSGKELMFCSMIYSDLNFAPENVSFYCSENLIRPILIENKIENLKFKDYIGTVDNGIKTNQTEKAPL